jgi:hypothetical protein
MLQPNDPILTAIANLKQQLADMTANPKPDYSVGNRSISWGAHFANLTGQLENLLHAAQSLDGPWEINQRVYAG